MSMSEGINTSGLEPRGRALLVEMYEPEHKAAGTIIVPDIVKDKTQILEQRAIVIAIGPSCWHDEPHPRCAVGEKVLVTRFAGYMAIGPADGKRYRLVNDRDVFAAITREAAKQLEAVNG
jgi:co-chaperonin GroES (HSP10)